MDTWRDKLKKNILSSFTKVKSELDDHLYAINQNTQELSVVEQQLLELTQKIDKLSGRIDELSLSSTTLSLPDKIDLTLREQEVFLALYTADSQKSIGDISRYLGLSEDMAQAVLYRLIEKGVPLESFSENNVALFALASDFKDIQARKTIVELDERVLEEFRDLDKEPFVI
ncbi:MAG: hypothetical protein ACLFNM_03720 [Candidatus Woesearchaeota archaeon]